MNRRVDWRDRRGRLERVITDAVALTKYAAGFRSESLRRLAILGQLRARVAIAGAQGNGKSTLVKALLASRTYPDPPVPIAEREETRIPIIYRHGERAVFTELSTTRRRQLDGALGIEDVRRRTSADSRFYDRVSYARLRALEIEDPRFQLPADVDIVDLPGVAGNLAGVTEWTRKNVIEQETQCIVFVVGSSQTIDCCEAEANVIRAFGAMLPDSIFVQNVWSGYDDPVEETREHNVAFLTSHLGKPPVYFTVDCALALRAAAGGDKGPLASVSDHLAPLLEGDRGRLVSEEAMRCAARLRGLMGDLEEALLRAKGAAEEAQEFHEKLEGQRAALKKLSAELVRYLDDAEQRGMGQCHDRIDAAFGEFTRGIERYLVEEDAITEKLLERRFSDGIGDLNRTIRALVEEWVQGAVQELQARLGEEIADASSEEALVRRLENLNVPGLEAMGLRDLLAGVRNWLPRLLGIGGATLALLAGPVGVFAGAIAAVLGGSVGDWIGRKMGTLLKDHVETPLALKQCKALMEKLGPELEDKKGDAIDGLRSCIHGMRMKLEQHVGGVLDARGERLNESQRRSLDADPGSLEAELRAAAGVLASVEAVI